MKIEGKNSLELINESFGTRLGRISVGCCGYILPPERKLCAIETVQLRKQDIR